MKFLQMPFPSLVICSGADPEKYLNDWGCFYFGNCVNVTLDDV